MAQITKITVGFGYTKNMGNLESLRVDCSLEATAREQVRKELDRLNGEADE